MAVLIALTVLLAVYGAWATFRLRGYAQMRSRLDETQKELERQRMLRQNLERVCDKRGAELKRLRAVNARQSAAMQELEQKASELNVTMFRESGLRILAEKEEGARRMKMELLEKQLLEARKALKEQDAQARGADAMYQAIIAEKDQQIAKLQAAHAKRVKTRARAEGIPDQISMDDLISATVLAPAEEKKTRKKAENAHASI